MGSLKSYSNAQIAHSRHSRDPIENPFTSNFYLETKFFFLKIGPSRYIPEYRMYRRPLEQAQRKLMPISIGYLFKCLLLDKQHPVSDGVKIVAKCLSLRLSVFGWNVKNSRSIISIFENVWRNFKNDALSFFNDIRKRNGGSFKKCQRCQNVEGQLLTNESFQKTKLLK